MQIIEIYLEAGEGEKGVNVLKELEVNDFSLVKSPSGDVLVIRRPLDKTDAILSKFGEEFKFDSENHRGIIVSTPNVVYPKGPEKDKKLSEKSAWENVIEYGEENACLDSRFLALFVFSTIVATLGLITNNVAVVVGAMIIAPAFGPLASSSIGVVTGRMDLFRNGLKSELIGVLLAIAVAAVVGAVLPGVEMNDLLRSRMYPTIFDLFIALAAGAAGGYVLVSSKSTSVVGVMVAAALVPVMAAIGIGFVFLNPILVLGALLLLIVNIVAISLAMVIVFWFAGPEQERMNETYHQKAGASDVEQMVEGMRLSYENKLRQITIKRMVKYSLVLIVVLAIPLMWMTYEDIIAKNPEKEITETFANEKYQDLELGSVLIEGNRVLVTIYDFDSTGEETLSELYKEIRDGIDPRYTIEFNIVQAARKVYS